VKAGSEPYCSRWVATIDSRALRITARFPTRLKLRLRVLTAFGGLAADVVADVFIGFAFADALAVDGDDAARVREGGFHGVGGLDQHRALFDAPVPLFGRAVDGRFGGEGFLDRGEQVVLVAFDLEAVVPAFFDDGLRGVGNGMQAVGGVLPWSDWSASSSLRALFSSHFSPCPFFLSRWPWLRARRSRGRRAKARRRCRG